MAPTNNFKEFKKRLLNKKTSLNKWKHKTGNHFNKYNDIAIKLVNEHLPDWIVKYMDTHRILGQCNLSKKIIRLSINLIKSSATDEHFFKQVVLHEIAHGIDGGGGHGQKWKEIVERIGGYPHSCIRKDDIKILYSWRGECVNSECSNTKQYKYKSCPATKFCSLCYKILKISSTSSSSS